MEERREEDSSPLFSAGISNAVSLNSRQLPRRGERKLKKIHLLNSPFSLPSFKIPPRLLAAKTACTYTDLLCRLRIKISQVQRLERRFYFGSSLGVLRFELVVDLLESALPSSFSFVPSAISAISACHHLLGNSARFPEIWEDSNPPLLQRRKEQQPQLLSSLLQSHPPPSASASL